MRLLSLVVFIAVIGVFAVAQEAPAYISDSEILPPGFERPLVKDMSLSEIKAAAPKRSTVWVEQLSNGAAYCTIEDDYNLLLLLLDDKLVDMQVKGVKSKSSFGRWFTQSVKSLPPDSTTYTSDDESNSKRRTESWSTSNSTWVAKPSSSKGRMDYSILYPSSQLVLSDGMIVRVPVFPDSTNSNLVPKEIKFDTPPEPVIAPKPSFPEEARERYETGKVMIQAFIDARGGVWRWSFLSIEPMGVGFAAEVEKVLSEWKFDPATKDGKPEGMWIAIPFTFKIKEQ